MRLKLKIYTWATALIVALAFLLAQVSCSGPTVHVGQQNKDSLMVARIQELEYHTQVLEEKLRQKDTTEMIMWARIVELDSMVQERKFKRDRWGKAGAFIGGVIKAVK